MADVKLLRTGRHMEYATHLEISMKPGFCTRCEQRVEPLAHHITQKHRVEYSCYTRASTFYLLALESASIEPQEASFLLTRNVL
jgi:hypothetical protein